MVKTILHCHKRLFSFQNEQLFVLNDTQSTQNTKTFWDEWNILDTAIMRVATSRKQVTIVSRSVFVVKRVLNRMWNWLLVFRCKLDFTQMVFDSRFQLCDQWNTAYNRKRKQEHFWIILWRALELLKENKSQKTIPVT